MKLIEATERSSLAVRSIAYMNERFPLYQLLGQIPLFLVAYLAGQLFAGRPTVVGSGAVLGCAAFVAYTFAARALDDHKDFDHDTRHYPERVLQRGLITLRHLKVAGGLCFAFSLVASLIIDRGVGWVTFWWILSVASNGLYQGSMMRRPRMKAWLEERRVLFAFTHLPFWGLGGLWIAQMGAGHETLPLSAGWLVASWIVGPLLLEFARKSRAPEDERATVVDYTKPRQSWAHSLGLGGAAASMVVTAILTTLLSAGLLWAVGCGSAHAYWWLAGTSAVLLVPVAIRFAMAPSRRRAKEVAELSATSMIVNQIVLVVVMLSTH